MGAGGEGKLLQRARQEGGGHRGRGAAAAAARVGEVAAGTPLQYRIQNFRSMTFMSSRLKLTYSCVIPHTPKSPKPSVSAYARHGWIAV